MDIYLQKTKITVIFSVLSYLEKRKVMLNAKMVYLQCSARRGQYPSPVAKFVIYVNRGYL
jgi:hypothetical protein